MKLKRDRGLTAIQRRSSTWLRRRLWSLWNREKRNVLYKRFAHALRIAQFIRWFCLPVAALPFHPQCGLNRETFPCVETRLR